MLTIAGGILLAGLITGAGWLGVQLLDDDSSWGVGWLLIIAAVAAACAVMWFGFFGG